ncbi:MAG: DnaJ domain-containing protein [Candidatus Limnocylindrales bacterium]
MARQADPFRTLEVSRGATLDEVKASYRRLAKLYHPDSAGEKALPRFLAIQAAYESLTEGPARLRLGTTPRDRGARSSTAAGSRSTGTSARASGSGSRSGGTDARSTTGGGRSSSAGAGTGRTGQTGRGATGSSNGSSGSSAGSTAGPRPRRDRRKPTSTSYDGADLEPFEPEWEGASWYGGSSGTYWTLNPKEFADPRKHGPEYQARGRREAAKAEQAARAAAAADPATAAEPATGTAATEGPAPGDPRGHTSAEARDRDVPPATRTTASADDGAGDPVTQRPSGATSGGSSAAGASRADRLTPPTESTPADDPPPGGLPTDGLPPDGGPVPAGAGFRASAARFVRGLTGTARRGT